MPTFRAGDSYAIDPAIGRDSAPACRTGAPNRVWIAEADDPGGTVYLRPNHGGGGAHVAHAGFVTAPEARGHGVARVILARALAEARAAGFRAMQFNFVVETNAAARHLWTTAGFEEVGRLPQAFRHLSKGYVDALVFYRLL